MGLLALETFGGRIQTVVCIVVLDPRTEYNGVINISVHKWYIFENHSLLYLSMFRTSHDKPLFFTTSALWGLVRNIYSLVNIYIILSSRSGMSSLPKRANVVCLIWQPSIYISVLISLIAICRPHCIMQTCISSRDNATQVL